MKLNLIALTTLIIASFSARAQNNDRVITVSGDTIACQIDLPVFGAPKYRTSKNEKAKKITTDSVKEYYTADKSTWFRRVIYPKGLRVTNKVRFMTVVESGKINLYQMIASSTGQGANGAMYTNSYAEWYVSKGTDTAILIKGTLWDRQKRKNEFADLLADHKTIYDKYMASDKFSFNEIRNIVHAYNALENFQKRPMVDVSGIDFVITKKNDTIHGRIKHDFLKGYFTFTEKNKNDSVKIDSINIHEFFYSAENSFFLLKTLPEINANEFVKCLERGKVNLFEFAKSTGSLDHPVIKYYWYVNKGTGSLIAIKIDANSNYDIRSHKELLAAFRNIISDNKDILSTFNYDINYVTSNTDSIIRSYINNYNKDYAENQTKNR